MAEINKYFLGVDPGAKGGAAILDEKGNLLAVSRFDGGCPGEVVAQSAEAATKLGGQLYICLEKVGAAPGQGVTSMFTFGVGVGLIKGWLAAKGFQFVEASPHSWQRWITGDLPTPKERAKALAASKWGLDPFIFDGCRVPHNGCIDAACIAEFTRQTVMGGGEVITPVKKKRRAPIKMGK